eukprot:COSAG02_NODE_6511_length_3526_cov_16.997374_3_plen_55_part_00
MSRALRPVRVQDVIDDLVAAGASVLTDSGNIPCVPRSIAVGASNVEAMVKIQYI